MDGGTNAATGKVMTIPNSQISVDDNNGSFNTGFSSIIRCGNIIIINIGGSNISAGLNHQRYLYNLPKCAKQSFAPIYDFNYGGMVGYLRMEEGETNIYATTIPGYSNTSAVTMQMIYPTEEGGGA